MKFQIIIPREVYSNWDSYTTWDFRKASTFGYYLRMKYPEYIDFVSIHTGDKRFIFHSEAHYTWFLLHQSGKL